VRVLLVRLSSLGDVVLATAAVEALAASLPSATVHVVSRTAHVGIFRRNPRVESVLGWEPRTAQRGLVALLARGGYDWIVDLQGTPRTRALALAVRGPRWSRIRKGSLRRRAAAWLHRPGLLPECHVVERYVAALRPLGVRPGAGRPRVYLAEEDRMRAEALLRGEGWDGARRLVGLAPGARWATKAWPAKGWAHLAAELGAGGAALPVLVGAESDRSLCEAIGAQASGGCLNLAGRTPPLETAAVLERCSVLVTNDSAPMHLSTAVGTPVVALFGPTVPAFGFRPMGDRDVVLERELPCRPCSVHGGERCPRGHHACLAELPPANVLAALDGFLGSRVPVEDPSQVPSPLGERGRG
jgi:heptosyltransferase-2